MSKKYVVKASDENEAYKYSGLGLALYAVLILACLIGFASLFY